MRRRQVLNRKVEKVLTAVHVGLLAVKRWLACCSQDLQDTGRRGGLETEVDSVTYDLRKF